MHLACANSQVLLRQGKYRASKFWWQPQLGFGEGIQANKAPMRQVAA